MRQLSPPETCAGAVVLDPAAMPTGRGDVARVATLGAALSQDVRGILDAAAGETGSVADLSLVARLARMMPDDLCYSLKDEIAILDGKWIVRKDQAARCERDLLDALGRCHQANPRKSWCPMKDVTPDAWAQPLRDHVWNDLAKAGKIRRRGAMCALATHDPISMLSPAEVTRMTQIAAAFHAAALEPPAPSSVLRGSVDQDLFELLVEVGNLVPLTNVALRQVLTFHQDALANAASLLGTHFPSPTRFTTSQARAALATSRRVVVPVLEHFDAIALTARAGNERWIAAP